MAGRAVDQDGLDGVGRGRAAAEHDGLTGDGLRADGLADSAFRAEVHAQHHVGVQDGDEPLEIPLARGGVEGVDDLALAGAVGRRLRRGALDPAARAAGQLAGSLGRALDHRRDLVERHGEHVVQDEGQPLGR